VVGVAALPAGTAAAIVGLVIYAANGTKSIFLPALAATIVLLVECVIATEAIGRVLDRTDISDVPAGE
jgi:multisubunit Na+/H+ antiporter MnhG subunit